MTLKELNIGDEFATRANPTFVYRRWHQSIGGRNMYVCKSPYGDIKLSGDIEVIKL